MPQPFLPNISEKEAKDQLWAAAQRGDANAMYFLAEDFFQNGDRKAAATWLRAAADRESPLALSIIYTLGLY